MDLLTVNVLELIELLEKKDMNIITIEDKRSQVILIQSAIEILRSGGKTYSLTHS